MLIEVVRLEKLSDWTNALRLARTAVAPFFVLFRLSLGLRLV